MDHVDAKSSSNATEPDAIGLLLRKTDAQEPHSLPIKTSNVNNIPTTSLFVAPPPPPPLRQATLPTAATNQSSRDSVTLFQHHSPQYTSPGPSHLRHGSLNASPLPLPPFLKSVSAQVDNVPLEPPSPKPESNAHPPSTTSTPNDAYYAALNAKLLADRSGPYASSTAYPSHFYQYPQHFQHTAFHSNSLPVNYFVPPFPHTYSAMQSHPHPRGYSHPIPLSQPGPHQYFYPSPSPFLPSPPQMGNFHSTVYRSPSPALTSSVSTPGPSPPPRPPKPPELRSMSDSATYSSAASTSSPLNTSMPGPAPRDMSPRDQSATIQELVDVDADDPSRDRPLGPNTANGVSGQPISVSARGVERSHTSDHSERSLDIYFTPPEDTLSSQALKRRLGVGPLEGQDETTAEPAMAASTIPTPRMIEREENGLDNMNLEVQTDAQNQPSVEELGRVEDAPPPTYEQVLREPLRAALISPIPRPLAGSSTSRSGNRLPQPPQSPPPGFNEPVFEQLDQFFNSVAATTQPSSRPSSDAHVTNTTASTNSHGRELGLQQGNMPSSMSHDSHPTILTSPPTPSPTHSRTNSRASPTAFRHPTLPRRFTLSSVDSPPKSPASESGDIFSEPAAFQADASPFVTTFPPEVGTSTIPLPSDDWTTRPEKDSKSQFEGRRSYSGIWSKKSSAPPTPDSEVTSDELFRHGMDSSKQASIGKGKQRLSSGLSNSRLSTFFRPSSSHDHPASPNRNGTSPEGDSRNPGGVDLLGDLNSEVTWGPMSDEPVGEPSVPHPADVALSELEPPADPVTSDLWDGIEFGFRNPVWDAVPTKGPYSDPSKWPESITLYPIGSDPFYIRAPTWRSLLRFLASQSATRIEPSVEALATSRTPTIDLRLVVQFVRTPFTPKKTTRDVCLYFTLHCEMPAANTKLGRNMSTSDRSAMETWNTRVLPYGFISGQQSFLMHPGVRPDPHNTIPGLRGTPLRDQDPDGEDSMFVTLPPPFVELPVKLSDVALYLHECLVLSRHEGKVRKTKDPGKNNLEPPTVRLRRGNGSSTTLPEETNQTPFPSAPSTPGESEHRRVTLLNVPGINRLAKAIRSIYPDEYALGSARSNAANSAGDQDEVQITKVTNYNHHNKSGGTRKGGIMGAFQRMRSKSSVAKQAVEEMAVGSGSSRRDMNAERFELVIPWRQTAE